MRMFSVLVFRVLCVTLAFFCVPGGVLLGQEGFSPERLEKIDQFLEEATGHDHRVAGVAALVARNGRIVYVSAKGFRDIEAGDPLEQDDIFRIASQTKTITAIGVMMLYEEGKLLLDDPVSKYIPEFRNAQVLKTFNEADSTRSEEHKSELQSLMR